MESESNNNKTSAIQFITCTSDNKFELTNEAINFLENIEDQNLGIISVVGQYRTGKSFFINRVLLQQDSNNGFKVGPTINPCTKGLYLWGKLVKNDEGKQFLIIDTEGFGGIDERDKNRDMRIFLFSLLLSSYIIYNTVGAVQDQYLQNLYLLIKIGEKFGLKEAKNFPSLLWIIRDFALQMTDQNNQKITPSEYLENCLKYQNFQQQSDKKNEVRECIRNSFIDRKCCTLIRPAENEKDLQKLDSIPNDQLRPEFIKQIENVRRTIFQTARNKTFEGKSLSGVMIINMVKKIIALMNQGDVPNLQSTWDYVMQQEQIRAFKETVDFAQKLILQNQQEITKKIGQSDYKIDFQQNKKDIKNQIIKQFMKNSFNFDPQFKEQCIAQIKQKLKDLFSQEKEKINSLQEQNMQKQLNSDFIEIEDKIKQQSIQNIGVLQMEIQQLQNKYLQSNNMRNSQFMPYNKFLLLYMKICIIQKEFPHISDPESTKQFFIQLNKLSFKVLENFSQKQQFQIDKHKQEQKQIEQQKQQFIKQEKQLQEQIKTLNQDLFEKNVFYDTNKDLLEKYNLILKENQSLKEKLENQQYYDNVQCKFCMIILSKNQIVQHQQICKLTNQTLELSSLNNIKLTSNQTTPIKIGQEKLKNQDYINIFYKDQKNSVESKISHIIHSVNSPNPFQNAYMSQSEKLNIQIGGACLKENHISYQIRTCFLSNQFFTVWRTYTEFLDLVNSVKQLFCNLTLPEELEYTLFHNFEDLDQNLKIEILENVLKKMEGFQNIKNSAKFKRFLGVIDQRNLSISPNFTQESCIRYDYINLSKSNSNLNYSKCFNRSEQSPILLKRNSERYNNTENAKQRAFSSQKQEDMAGHQKTNSQRVNLQNFTDQIFSRSEQKPQYQQLSNQNNMVNMSSTKKMKNQVKINFMDDKYEGVLFKQINPNIKKNYFYHKKENLIN